MKYYFKILILVLFSSVYKNSISQEVSNAFRIYILKDGLAGNNVYCATQDKEGFIWFGTETGLSRFDGSHFKNYTVADGLPDNEIINIFTDSKGRIWLVPFKKALCYIYKRKVFNADRDSVLKKIKIEGNCYNITEDNEKRIIIHDTKAIHILEQNGTLNTIKANVLGNDAKFINIYRTSTGNIFVLSKREVFKLQQNYLKKVFSLPDNDYMPFNTTTQIVTDTSLFKQNPYLKYTKNNTIEYMFSNEFVRSYETPSISGLLGEVDSVFYTTSLNKLELFSIRNSKNNKTISINKFVNRIFMDEAKNSYLLTRNGGVFLNYSFEMKYQYFSNYGMNNLSVNYLNGNGKDLFIGAENNNPIIVSKSNLSEKKYLTFPNSRTNFGKDISEISYINLTSKKEIIISNTYGIILNRNDKLKYITERMPIKFVEEIEGHYLIGTTDKLILLNKLNYKILDTIWNERTTAANFVENNYLVGTINGLYKVSLNKKHFYLGDSFPIFKSRISYIKKDKLNTIWIGTYDAGVVAYKNGKILQIINEASGMTSNICRNLYINDNYLWVGTDKGLNKIDISKQPYKVVKNYTTTDGLASNMINTIYTDSNMVYIGTPEGLAYFDETKISNQSKCEIRILGITISGVEQQWDSSKIILKNTDNNIRIDFVGLSFRSIGDIVYRYRLKGPIDKEW